LKRSLRFLVLLAAACSGSSPGTTGTGGSGGTGGAVVDACAIVAGKNFQSVSSTLSCGVGASGMEEFHCRYFLRFFSSDHYTWSHADVEDGGSYSCDGLKITGVGGTMGATGMLDMNDYNHLTWGGVEYVFWSTNV